jgi:hypothetical protein
MLFIKKRKCALKGSEVITLQSLQAMVRFIFFFTTILTRGNDPLFKETLGVIKWKTLKEDG